MKQAQINAVLIDRARQGQVVVRLKGGDPFVFGRGGEELLACAEAGVTCEVIPGITSAVAGPAAAGIPVTHRGMARSFAIVTASTAGTAHEPDAVDLSRVATATDTLVLLMAAGRLSETCAALIDAGRPADEPAALITWATTPEERTVIGTLADLPSSAAAASMGPPATLVVGEVAAIPAHAVELASIASRSSTTAP
jgi:uroporphyrin-III C-methyltransferase